MADEKTTIEVINEKQQVRRKIADNCPMIRDDQVMEMMQDYGMEYFPPDSNTLRLCMLLASAERMIEKVE
jgi:hypothetical protein